METVEAQRSGTGPLVIGRQTVKGGTWTVGARIASRIIDLGTMVVLAHILQPKDFGLVAIAMTVIYIVEAALELPISQALIRLPTVEDAHYDTAFTLGLLRALAVSLIVCLVSWPFAHFYKDPRLLALVCCLSLAPASRGFVSPRLADFSRRLDFFPDFRMEMIGKCAAFVTAIVIGLTTGSYWSIAVGTLMAPIVGTATSYVLAPYRPRLTLSKISAFSGFLGWITAAQVVGAVNWQADRLLLGKLTSRAALGLFTAANDTANVPLSALLGPLLRPLLSAFSVVREDHKRLVRSYQNSSCAIVTLALPVLVGESLIADAGVKLMFGDKWLGAAPLLRWLALSLIPTLFAVPVGPLVMTFDKTRIFFQRNLLEISIKLPLVVFGAFRFGFMGVVAARGISEAATVCFCMLVVRRLIGIPIRQQLLSPWRSLVSAAVMAGVVGWLVTVLSRAHTTMGLAAGTLATILIGAATYCVVLYSLWFAANRPPGLEAMVAERVSGSIRFGRNSTVPEAS